MSEVYQGGCACGQLRFTARGTPKRVGLCHCMTCRKTSGSAFNAFVIFPREAVAVEGEFKAWAASGGDDRAFCPVCGSPVFAHTATEMEMRLGAFDAPNVFAPSYEAWIGRREHWLKTEGLKAYEQNQTDF